VSDAARGVAAAEYVGDVTLYCRIPPGAKFNRLKKFPRTEMCVTSFALRSIVQPAIE
jgi:hypothetical protein